MDLKILLASKSPRRQELIKHLQIPFDIVEAEVDESFPLDLSGQEIPLYLSKKKADAFANPLASNEILVTADTIVWINNKVLNKPENKDHAIEMLLSLAGQTHEVFTGVCLTTKHMQVQFAERTVVQCRKLTLDEINFYIDTCHPFDKAGSYGIQDWFGLTAVERIEGCFYNVMGLPMSRLYKELKNIF